MSNINLSIGGRSYAVACAPGEEGHVKGLGKVIDDKLAGMPGLAGQPEARTLLYAALLLADELHEANGSRGGPAPQPTAPAAPDNAIAESLEGLAARLESLASRLENAG